MSDQPKLRNTKGRVDVTVDGQLWVFIRPTDAVRFLDTIESVNRGKHAKCGGHWPYTGDDRYRERCGFTGEVLNPEDGVCQVISNQAGVPNRIVSAALFDSIGPEAAARRLADGWCVAREFWKQHGHWFT